MPVAAADLDCSFDSDIGFDSDPYCRLSPRPDPSLTLGCGTVEVSGNPRNGALREAPSPCHRNTQFALGPCCMLRCGEAAVKSDMCA